MVRRGQKDAECQRSIIVAHNAAFDQSFVMAAAERTGVKRNPFHPFGMFDTATLAGFYVWANSTRQSVPSGKNSF